MPVLTSENTKTVRGVTLHRDPAREPCFTVVHLHKDLHDYDDMSETSRRQRLHRHMHNEMQTLEIAAQGLADFPEAPWELRLQLARQCWDEARHTSDPVPPAARDRWPQGRVPGHELRVGRDPDAGLAARAPGRPESYLRGRGDGPATAADRYVDAVGRSRRRPG